MFCNNCGKEIIEDSTFCPNCGNKIGEVKKEKSSSTRDTLLLVAKIFMIIATATSAIFIIPLAWMLPMTLSLHRKMENKEPISVTFKVCTLLFVSLVAGILLLCTDDANN